MSLLLSNSLDIVQYRSVITGGNRKFDSFHVIRACKSVWTLAGFHKSRTMFKSNWFHAMTTTLKLPYQHTYSFPFDAHFVKQTYKSREVPRLPQFGKSGFQQVEFWSAFLDYSSETIMSNRILPFSHQRSGYCCGLRKIRFCRAKSSENCSLSNNSRLSCFSSNRRLSAS